MIKRAIIAVVLGLGIICLGWFLTVVLIMYALRLSAPQEFVQSSPLITVIRSLPWLFSLLAGFVAGYVAKNKGWFYGSLAGAIVVIGITIALIFAHLRPQGILSPEFSDEYTKELLFKNIQKSIGQGLFMIIVTGTGGWFGERVSRRKINQLGKN